jgi:PDZ domain-containing protein
LSTVRIGRRRSAILPTLVIVAALVVVFALAIYDKITPGTLLEGKHIAGTGTITPEGDVGAIGGIQEKIAGAEKAGATAFLVPAPNCQDLVGLKTDLTLIKISTLDDAIAAVGTLNSSADPGQLPHC